MLLLVYVNIAILLSGRDNASLTKNVVLPEPADAMINAGGFAGVGPNYPTDIQG